MPKKASKAPKERVNIIYRPATRPNETVELPFKMLVMADVTGAPDDRPFEERKPISIDKDSFADVLRETGPKLRLEVPNRLSEDAEGDTLGAELKFESMKDFTPGGIANQVPELAKLLELREALSALKSPLGNRKDFRARIESILKDEGAKAKLLQELGLDDGKGEGE